MVDAPALSECSDALSLAKVCDGALLVVQSGGVTHQELRQAAHLLQGCGLPLLGISVITNMAAGITGEAVSGEEVNETGAAVAERFSRYLEKILEEMDV